MTIHNTPLPLRIATAAAFTTGALAIVLQDILDLRSIPTMLANWTLVHTLAVLAVVGVTLTAELGWDARKSQRYTVARGFMMVTVVGLGLIVYNSVGRQAENANAKHVSASAHNKSVDDAAARLSKAEAAMSAAASGTAAQLVAANARVASAVKAKADAVAGAIANASAKNCATKCADLLKKAQDDAEHELTLAREAVASGVAVAVREARQELAGARNAVNDLGPAVEIATVSAKAKQWGETLTLIGISPATTERFASRLEYIFWTLFFEIGSMVSWCFVRQRPQETIAATATVDVKAAAVALLQKAVAWLLGAETAQKATEATSATVDAELARLNNLRVAFFAPDNDPDPQPTPPGNRRRKQPKSETKATVANRQSATVIPLHAGNRAQKVSEAEALKWLRDYTASNGCLDEQDAMAEDLDVNKGSVSKWLDKWETEELIERQQVGRRKIVRMLPAKASA